MKLKIINPDYGLSNKELKEREDLLGQVTRNDTKISMTCPTKTKVYIDSDYDVAIATGEILQLGKKAEEEGYDGLGLYCFSDPGIIALREALTIPVVGGAQSSLSLACQLGYNFSLITTDPLRIPSKESFIRSLGFSNRLHSIAAVEGKKDIKIELKDKIMDLKAKGAQVVILGCLSWTGMGKDLSRECGLPVVDPGFTMVLTLEMLVKEKLSHSKISYPYPGKKY